MNFEGRLRKILRSLFVESDYTNNWEEFRQERERLRTQAAEDQDKAHKDEIQDKFQQHVQKYGGFAKWMANSDWEPGDEFQCLEDIETGNGILLPSLRAKNKDLVLFIPWALIRIIPPFKSQGSDEVNEGQLLDTYPFCQFESDNWPNASDFDWESVREEGEQPSDFVFDETWNKRLQLNDKAAMKLFSSDKNHYHMLNGADKAVVDNLVDQKVEIYLSEIEPVEYSDYYDE